MNSLNQAIYNWLTIKLVADGRKEDFAAKETVSLFEEILHSEYKVFNKELMINDRFYIVNVDTSEGKKTFQFSKDVAESLLNFIEQHEEKFTK